MSNCETMEIEFTDVSGQRSFWRDVDGNESVKDIIEAVIAESNFTRVDSQGRPLTYQARLEREGRHVHPSEVAQETFQPRDRVVLTPNVDAGSK